MSASSKAAPSSDGMFHEPCSIECVPFSRSFWMVSHIIFYSHNIFISLIAKGEALHFKPAQARFSRRLHCSLLRFIYFEVSFWKWVAYRLRCSLVTLHLSPHNCAWEIGFELKTQVKFKICGCRRILTKVTWSLESGSEIRPVWQIVCWQCKYTHHPFLCACKNNYYQ